MRPRHPPAAESGVGKHTARESERAHACAAGKERVANAHPHFLAPGPQGLGAKLFFGPGACTAVCGLENAHNSEQLSTMPDTNPVTFVVAEILARLNEAGFEPFTIVMSDGSRIDVPTPDHCSVSRLLRRITVEHDDGAVFYVNPLHVIKLERLKPAA